VYYSGSLSHAPEYQRAFFPLAWLCAVNMFVLNGRVELRTRGILVGGVLFRWPRIDSYAWRPAGDGFVVLELHMWQRVLPFLPRTKRPVPVVIPAERSGDADLVLKKQFVEWPGRTVT
jgi:hypothetical protein